MATKTVLFFQHAGVLGGSVKSLRMLIQFLQQTEYRAKVCLLNPSPEVTNYYAAHNIETISTGGILPIFHTSGSWAHLSDPVSTAMWMQGLIHWRKSVNETRRIIEAAPCDLVHLNSSILLPSAFALQQMGRKFIWHVRESPQPQYFGNRLRIYRACLANWPSERVFLSASDRLGWMGANNCGVVIPNSVDDELFDVGAESCHARQQLGLPQNIPCILYLGGFSQIKGIFVLLDAFQQIVDEGHKFLCLMPGTMRVRGSSFRSRLGRAILKMTSGGTDEMKALSILKQSSLKEAIHLMSFQNDLRNLLGAADLLVFPATAPHFAMPVLEAGAAGRPVIASDFEGMRELIQNERTGLLVTPGDSRALATAIKTLLAQPDRRKAMGTLAQEHIRQQFSLKAEGTGIVQIYDRVIRESEPCVI